MNLATMNFKNEKGLIFTRDKLRSLFLDLKVNEIQATRLTIYFSELLRAIIENDEEVRLRITIENRETPTLSITFNKPNIPLGFKGRVGFVESLKIDSESITFLKNIPSDLPLDSEDFIENIKEKLAEKSEDELKEELEENNKKLSKLLEDLKRSSTMIQTEKMRALGTMTAGVAHELNNPMMGIINFIQYGIRKTDNEKVKMVLQDAEKEVLRCIDIVKNLLTFSRMEKEGKKFVSTDLSILVERVIKIIAYRMRKDNVTILKEYQDSLPSVTILADKIQQVILNLVGNAFDALGECEEKTVWIKMHTDEEFFYVTIQDNGPGISEEVRSQIFEPFFTTKPTDKGTGLGLSVSKSVMEEHHGDLICNTELGKGTEFILKIPLEFQSKSSK